MSKEQSKHVCLNCFSTNVKSIDEIKKGRDFYFKDRPLENAYEHGKRATVMCINRVTLLFGEIFCAS